MDETLRYISEPSQVPLLEAPKPRRHVSKIGAFILGIMPLVLLFFFYVLFISAPDDFPKGRVFQIEKGETLSGIAAELEAEKMIKSGFLFKVFVKILAPRSGALAGDYQFDKPQGSLVMAWRIAYGSYGLTLERITVPEGLNSSEMAALFAKNGKFYAFDASEFERLASAQEGFLFPDTYLFLPNVTAGDVVTAMRKNYEKRIATLSSDIRAFGKSTEDVIIMASIIEREARTEETRRTIAGILWKRLAEGMPLQVDAAFVFVNGKKDSKLLTLEDLAIDSPYNTYTHKGLPPGPIGNPGLDAISDTIHPISSPYYFYLSDSQGSMHYAVTHDEHVMNKELFLR